MNPIAAGFLLVVVFVLGLAPWRREGWKQPSACLAYELAAVTAALLIARLLTELVVPTSSGFVWGRAGLHVAAYWYATAGGISVVRMVLDVVPVAEAPAPGGIAVSRTELSRGRIIGVLERAIVLTLVLLGQYGAIGFLVAAKAIARFKELEHRDFAEYFLIGTLASLLHALAVGLAVRLLI